MTFTYQFQKKKNNNLKIASFIDLNTHVTFKLVTTNKYVATSLQTKKKEFIFCYHKKKERKNIDFFTDDI